MLAKLLVLLLAGLVSSAPTTYDQRQSGELNVKVDLDNFVILIARPSSSSSSSSSSSLGMDLFGSMAQLLADAKRAQISQEDEPQSGKSEGLDDVAIESDQKPELVLVVQNTDKLADTVARTLRNLKFRKQHKLKTKYKYVDTVEDPQNLTLVGAEDVVGDNCGPGRSRDRTGVCQGNESLTAEE